MHDTLLMVVIVVAIMGLVWDFRFRRLPNWLCLLMALAGGLLSLHSGVLASSAIHAAVALLAGMGLFAIRWIGGGDAKFYAAAAMSMPLAKAPLMLFFISASGVVLVIAMFVARRMTQPSGIKGKTFLVPYGVAISTGTIITLLSNAP
jgi:prepilin peptidase CpaA